MTRSMMALILAAACASAGCMNAAYAVRPEGTSASQSVVGGLLGDAAIAGVAGAVIGYADDDQSTHDVRFFWPIFGSLVLIDAALLAGLHLTRRK